MDMNQDLEEINEIIDNWDEFCDNGLSQLSQDEIIEFIDIIKQHVNKNNDNEIINGMKIIAEKCNKELVKLSMGDEEDTINIEDNDELIFDDGFLEDIKEEEMDFILNDDQYNDENNRRRSNMNKNSINNENNKSNKKKRKRREYMRRQHLSRKKRKQGESSIGVWRRDKNGRKYYRALNAQAYYGKEAKLKQEEDIKRSKNAEFQLMYNNNNKELSEREIQEKTRDIIWNEMILTNEEDKKNIKKIDNNNDPRDISNFLSSKVVKLYKKHGIKTLFNWQYECIRINNNSVWDGVKNLVYSAPTSGGKTLVAELLMHKHMSDVGGSSLYLVPYISLANEKLEYLRTVLPNISIAGFYGDEQVPHSGQIHVGICTYERANTLINEMIREDTIDDLCTLIIDELHMLKDTSRCYIIELIISKLLMKQPSNLQIIGLSATLPNLHEIANWMDAELYITKSRPVDLTYYQIFNGIITELKFNSEIDKNSEEDNKKNEEIEEDNKKNSNEIKVSKSVRTTNRDQIISLVHDSIKTQKQVLIFCETRIKTEQLTKEILVGIKQRIKMLNNEVKKLNILRLNNNLIQIETRLNNLKNELNYYSGNQSERGKTLQHLKYDAHVPLNTILEKSILYGISFHHAGLTTQERKIIESGYLNGPIKILIATTTLAVGVNLPADRVIIDDIDNILDREKDISKIHQMSGRAGRKGMSNHGEVYFSTNKQNLGLNVLKTKLPETKSVLHHTSTLGIERALLESIVSGLVETYVNVLNYMDRTLYSLQNNHDDVIKSIQNSLHFLFENELIVGERIFFKNNNENDIKDDNNEENEIKTMNYEIKNIRATQKGQAIVYSGLKLNDALNIYKELETIRYNFLCKTDLQLLSLITPFNSYGLFRGVSTKDIAKIVQTGLSKEDIEIARCLGLKDYVLATIETGKQKLFTKDNKPTENYLLLMKFCGALTLRSLIEEADQSIWGDKIKSKYSALQEFQKTAGLYCSQVISFCRYLNWNIMENLLLPFEERLKYGVKRDLIKLMKIGCNDLSPARARLILPHWPTPSELAKADYKKLAEILIQTLPHQETKRLNNVTQIMMERSKNIIKAASNHIKKSEEQNKRLAKVITNNHLSGHDYLASTSQNQSIPI